jgi:hypothetical protein
MEYYEEHFEEYFEEMARIKHLNPEILGIINIEQGNDNNLTSIRILEICRTANIRRIYKNGGPNEEIKFARYFQYYVEAALASICPFEKVNANDNWSHDTFVRMMEIQTVKAWIERIAGINNVGTINIYYEQLIAGVDINNCPLNILSEQSISFVENRGMPTFRHSTIMNSVPPYKNPKTRAELQDAMAALQFQLDTLDIEERNQ